jgi:ABC-type uncharacterized transport system auxiliary subunit
MIMRTFWVLVSVGLLSGCGGGRVPATQYYKLEIPPSPMPAGAAVPASLRIEPFQATVMLRQDRIVYRPSPVEVGFYEYHRWAEPPNDTVTKALAEQLAKRNIFRSVEVSDGGEKVDYVLKGRVERLQEVDYPGGVRVQVSISAQLEDPAQQQTIWSGSASSESIVTNSNVQAVVMAMGRASQQSISRLMTDVTKFVQLNRQASVSSGGTPPR